MLAAHDTRAAQISFEARCACEHTCTARPQRPRRRPSERAPRDSPERCSNTKSALSRMASSSLRFPRSTRASWRLRATLEWVEQPNARAEHLVLEDRVAERGREISVGVGHDHLHVELI